MKIHYLFLFCIITVTASVSDAEECSRPDDLKTKEDYCWTREVEIVERVKQTSRSVLNFAKKKLGIGEVEEDNEPQKCEYYLCIFQQLKMMNANSYPAYESIKEWSAKHVTFQQAVEFMKQLDRCNDALTQSTLKESYFDADELDEKSDKSPPEIEQSKCEIASQFLKCLSKQKECPVFIFP